MITSNQRLFGPPKEARSTIFIRTESPPSHTIAPPWVVCFAKHTLKFRFLPWVLHQDPYILRKVSTSRMWSVPALSAHRPLAN